MMNVTIISVGKLKEKYLRDAIAEYSKRLQAFCNFRIIELDESRLSEKPSQREIEQALETEGKNILRNSQGFIFSMCIEGKQLSSEELAKKFTDIGVSGTSAVTFIIGSSFGLSDEVKKKSDFKLSMSKMTFPHQLARVMLTEQIYRAFQINNGGKYHK